jgi:hypothetical protein
METLKLFATYTTDLPLAAQAKRLRDQGWRTVADDNSLACQHTGVTLRLEQSGSDEFLLRGELERDQYTETNAAAPLAFLRECAEPFQLDIFEEDGRLVRRMSSCD